MTEPLASKWRQHGKRTFSGEEAERKEQEERPETMRRENNGWHICERESSGGRMGMKCPFVRMRREE